MEAEKKNKPRVIYEMYQESKISGDLSAKWLRL